MKHKIKLVLRLAKKLHKEFDSWIDLNNALFNPYTGHATKLFATREERAQFVGSKEYKAITKLIDSKR